ncbi:MAG: flagellar biosynthetic protein FliP, partial [Anaerohalosphaeraceae bacterium]
MKTITGLAWLCLYLLLPVSIHAAEEPVIPAPAAPNTMPQIPDIVDLIDRATTDNQEKPAEWSTPVKLVAIFTLLALIPSLLAMMTSFTRIVIVLGFVRRALGTQNIPPNTVVMGLALFLTLFTMAPTMVKMNEQAI